MLRSALFALAALAAGAVTAAPVELAPASPQPSGLKPGLAVNYDYPPDVKSLNDASRRVKYAKPGKPLAGLDYRDTAPGDLTLTSKQEHRVVADIAGYVKFDAPGTYLVDFVSNDGVQVWISGKEIIRFDGRHPCEESETAEVSVPAAGWYPLKVLYFQRLGTSCLHMRAGQGAPDWLPNSAFGH